MFFEVITINFVGFCFGFNLLVALVLSNSKMITFVSLHSKNIIFGIFRSKFLKFSGIKNGTSLFFNINMPFLFFNLDLLIFFENT